MSTAEWDIFKRIENLEQDIETAKPTLEDANAVSTFAFGLAFGNMVIRTPKYAKKMKDECTQHLKTLGVSPKVLGLLEQFMLKACDIAEESKEIT
jgi:hypothetical protein